MQEELLAGAPPSLSRFSGLAFHVFLSHRRATGQGPIGRIFQALIRHGDYRCFLDSDATFKLHNLRALVRACNYFLFFLSGGVLDSSPFCLEELLAAITSERIIFLVSDLSFALPDSISAAVRPVLRDRIGEDSLRENYGMGVEEAAAAIEHAIASRLEEKIVYHAEHFEPCMGLIRLKLGWCVEHGLSEKLQTAAGAAVDFASLEPLETIELRRVDLARRSFHFIKAVLVKSTTLTTLHLDRAQLPDDWMEFLAEGLAANAFLKTLTLNRITPSLGDAGVAMLCKALEANHSLLRLEIGNATIGPDGAAAIGSLLGVHPALTELKLAHVVERGGADPIGVKMDAASFGDVRDAFLANGTLLRLVRGIGIRAMAVEFRQLKGLSKFELAKKNDFGELRDGFHSEDHYYMHLCDDIDAIAVTTCAQADNSKLNRLTLGGLSDVGCMAIAETIKKRNSLTRLNLEGHMGAPGARALSSALAQGNTLTRLSLEGRCLGTEGSAALAERLAETRALTLLDLSNSDIGSDGMEVLAEALWTNKSIKTLTAKKCGFGWHGAQTLAEMLKRNTTLLELDICGNLFGGKGSESFIIALNDNVTLQKLAMRDCAIPLRGQGSLDHWIIFLKTVEQGIRNGSDTSEWELLYLDLWDSPNSTPHTPDRHGLGMSRPKEAITKILYEQSKRTGEPLRYPLSPDGLHVRDHEWHAR
mmetsp:Transcript_2885/g.10495  ORF Transcript_2885/g.10495 Transcript_2885/m.10495 type:complete len:703 (+) Transcript_2885:2-2110(+)